MVLLYNELLIGPEIVLDYYILEISLGMVVGIFLLFHTTSIIEAPEASGAVCASMFIK